LYKDNNKEKVENLSKNKIKWIRSFQLKKNRDEANVFIVEGEKMIQELIEYFRGSRRTFDTPLYQTGTDYQEIVWKELQNIPYGKTISYQQLADSIGDSKATRAVANANGKNKIMILIPCHRVIGSDRSFTGYAGGIWRKKWLFQHELKTTMGVQTLF
jgi:methylated-DNA-[protein]-cysteine S-methyltransferase